MAKSARKIEFYFSACRWNLDIEGTCEGTFQPGSPAVMYLRNGDPGYPADPAEFEPEEITITDNSIMQADMRERIAALEDALAHTIAKVIRLEEVLKP